MSGFQELGRTVLLCRDFVSDAVSDEDICRSLQSVRVLCVSDARNLSSGSGQSALVTLVSLLSRMGMQVGLSIPEISIISNQAPLPGTALRQTLIASSEAIVRGATVLGDSEFDPDVTFVLGDTNFAEGRACCWRLQGSDWNGELRSLGGYSASVWSAEWPVGGMVSAALAANEAFKFAVRRLPLKGREQGVFFEPSFSCGWDFGSIPLGGENIDLGSVDLISAGAITQACLYALLRMPKVSMFGRIFDDDLTASSNLNRNMLTLAADVGRSKVSVVAGRCAGEIHLEPVPRRFGSRGSAERLGDRVLVGVDDIPSRWEVQRRTKGWIAVSGTSHCSISSSAHRPGEPCSGCLHYLDDLGPADLIPTVSFVSFWAGLAMAVRLVREALGFPYPPNQQQLWLTPLRMDERYAAIWSPVAARDDCPVRCLASRNFRFVTSRRAEVSGKTRTL